MRLINVTLLVVSYYTLLCKATMVNFGFPRYPERDRVDWQVGMQVAINEANERGIVPGYNFSLILGNIPACTSPSGEECFVQAAADGVDFIGNMSTMSAILAPDWWIAQAVIEAAKPSKIPVLTPKTFDYSDTEHVVFLTQRMDADIPHTISFMLRTHECARTGLIMTRFLYTLDKVYDMQKAFVYGGYPTPPFILTNATDADMLEFILGEDPDRLCFMMQITLDEMNSIMSLVESDPRFTPTKYNFFAFNNIETPIYSVGSDTEVFDSFYITRHAPSFKANTSAAKLFVDAFNLWLGSSAHTADVATFLPGDISPTAPTEPAFFTYLVTRYAIELVRVASLPYRHLGTVPPASEVLDVAYTNRIYIGGIIYQPLIRQCPDEPLPQVCFCNVAARVTYTFKVNGTTGRLDQLYDDVAEGEEGVSTTVISPDVCSPPNIEASNYPIIISLFMFSAGEYVEMVRGISVMLNGLVTAINGATPAPTRPFRLYVYESDSISNEEKLIVDRRVQPFVTSLTMGATLNYSENLVVFPNANTLMLEDKPLREYVFGDENLLSTEPTIADCLHTLVGYYAQSPAGLYTSLAAMTTTEVEATLMRKSLNTFQFDISILVVTDPSQYLDTLQALTMASANPYVIISALNNLVLDAAILDSRNLYSQGVFGVATTEGTFMTFPTYKTIVGDIFFASMLSEWWMPTSSIRGYLNSTGTLVNSGFNGDDPTIFMAVATFAFSFQIAQQATVVSSTAADLLYQIGTVSVGDVTFGPYSNTTCTAQQIKNNDRDRSCQCYKGPRIFYLHSLLNINQKVWSQNTGRYRYSLATCGIVYQPYIPLMSDSSSISNGAIAGIAVAGFFAILLVIGGSMGYIVCVLGKKNRYAPRDSTKPFAIVFTDIQNSTGLWARTPAAMSQSVSIHHDLIRSLIKTYKGYEVKTIGDSFMIAFTDINNAVALALDIQTLFYNSEWPTDIDATYTELIAEAYSDDPNMSIAMLADEDKYNQLWKGIRVRVGIHYGIGDIRADPVSLGYDYYGTVVNTAARVEGVGHGGQVLLTDSAFDVLEATFIQKHEIQVIDLGPQPLRGLDTGVQLRQLLPKKFSARRFPALRLDVEHVIAVEGEGSDVTGSDTTDEIIPPDQMAQRISNMPGSKMDPDTILTYYNFLNVGFSAAPEKWRKGAVKELGKAWNIEVHKSANGRMRGLMQLAIKMYRAAKAKSTRRMSSNYTSSIKHQQRGNTDLSFGTIDGAILKQPDIERQSSTEGFGFSQPASPSTGVIGSRTGDVASPFEVEN